MPYACFVDTDTFKDLPDGSTRIEQTIYVETTGQKKILVGMIRDLGMRSRREMMKLLDRKVMRPTPLAIRESRRFSYRNTFARFCTDEYDLQYQFRFLSGQTEVQGVVAT